jgi:hypothetical protein
MHQMDETLSAPKQPFLLSLISRTRRNHALEHATLHVLGEQRVRRRMGGISTPWGFYIFGDVATEELSAAAQEALRRLKGGRHEMAVHANCGTNFAAAAILAGLGAFLVLGGSPKNRPKGFPNRLARLPLACLAALGGIYLARQVGPVVQAHVTTCSDVGGLCIASVARERRAGTSTVHLVRTRG